MWMYVPADQKIRLHGVLNALPFQRFWVSYLLKAIICIGAYVTRHRYMYIYTCAFTDGL